MVPATEAEEQHISGGNHSTCKCIVLTPTEVFSLNISSHFKLVCQDGVLDVQKDSIPTKSTFITIPVNTHAPLACFVKKLLEILLNLDTRGGVFSPPPPPPHPANCARTLTLYLLTTFDNMAENFI